MLGEILVLGLTDGEIEGEMLGDND